MQQIICRYEKGEPIRFIAHLDLMRAMQRALRRARIPLAFTQGRHPRPRVAYASPLAVGATSEAEIMALELEEPLDPAVVQDALNECLPDGLRILASWTNPPHKSRLSVGELDTSDFRVTICGPVDADELRRRVSALQTAPTIVYTRKREDKVREVDLRPFLSDIAVEQMETGRAVLRLRLKALPGGGASPVEILEVLGFTPERYAIHPHRIALFSSGTVGKAARRRAGKMLPRRRKQH